MMESLSWDVDDAKTLQFVVPPVRINNFVIFKEDKITHRHRDVFLNSASYGMDLIKFSCLLVGSF